MTVGARVDLTPRAFRSAMARFPSGVALLTSGPPESLTAMTVNSFVSVSLEPLLILVSVRAAGRMRVVMDRGGPYAIHVLGADQHEAAALFAQPDRPSGEPAARWLGAIETTAGNTVLPSALVSFECRPHDRHEAGDHILYIGEVIAMHLGPSTQGSLVFHRGRYGRAP